MTLQNVVVFSYGADLKKLHLQNVLDKIIHIYLCSRYDHFVLIS